MKNSLLSLLALLISTVGISQTQPPNIDFENWETITGPISNTYEEPLEWSTSNECTAIVNQFAVTKSTDAQSGSYSVRMETFQAFGNVRANGIITTAQMICLANGGGQEGGISYTEEFPDSLVGWYKYAPANSDSAYSQIMFLSNNDQDTTCYTRLDLHAAANWTRFSVALCPDAMGSAEKLSLFFSSSWGDGSQGEAEVGSTLFIDNISFVNAPQGIDEAESEMTWTVYPNPVVGELNVQVLRGEEANIEIIDVTGKLVKKERINEMNHKIDVNQLVTGIYLYQIRSLDNEVLRTGKLLVNP
ncbi:MAG: T9SS type A sorting domain-containing protein [Flavobacteriales bacterium]|nr:T9SS type A sorting domain-containing protein [Flavobacteriales bacterium]